MTSGPEGTDSGVEALATARALLAGQRLEDGCRTRFVLDAVTTRWGTLVVAALVEGPTRFAALGARVEGISDKMLSQTLRSLVRCGLVDRSVEGARPPRVTYSLTVMGARIAVPLCALIHWIGSNESSLIAAVERYDEDEEQRTGS